MAKTEYMKSTEMTDIPKFCIDYLLYLQVVRSLSPLTVREYYLDLRMFFRFIKLMRCDMPIDTRLDDIDIKDIDVKFIEEIETSDVFDFLSYLANDRTSNPDAAVPDYGISPSARARKLSAIKSFFKYSSFTFRNSE